MSEGPVDHKLKRGRGDRRPLKKSNADLLEHRGLKISNRAHYWLHKKVLGNRKTLILVFKRFLYLIYIFLDLTYLVHGVCAELWKIPAYTQSLIQAPHISNTFETGQNLGKIKQSTGVFKKKIEKISNNSNTSKQRWKALSNNDR